MFGIRKAGEALRNFDDMYAGKIAQMYLPDTLSSGDGGLVRGIAAGLGGGYPARMMPEEGPMAIRAGLPAISTAVRYGAPIAGTAVAVKGLQDIMTGLSSQQTAESVMPQ